MAGLVPAIYVFAPKGFQDVDARAKRGHDEEHGDDRRSFPADDIQQNLT
ncbi:hypothetical protein [Blastochloris viridis]|uniref:Uncharacterized protein n=1 Tax=Blastochloris viridis TaxID=1079 RepID=A0A182CZG0_BLAVI|nr:hypothetical protein [Blastochloris viridis]BAR98343.1 hypothetical protein BV133_750 [Blastochloris viridis]